MSLYRVVALGSRPLMWAAFRPRVRGRTALPRAGGFVLSANHLSGWDVWAISYALFPRLPRNMAKNQLFVRPLLGPIVRGLGGFPAHGHDGSSGADLAAALARSGDVVVIFPEGARRRGRERRPRTGAARAALAAGVPLIPAAIRGTEGWRRLRRWQVAIGAAVPLDDLREADEARAAREATTRLWRAIVDLEATLQSG